MSIKSFRRVARLFPLCPVPCSISPTPSEHAQITLETDACSTPLLQCCPLSVTDSQALRKPPPSLSLSPSVTRPQTLAFISYDLSSITLPSSFIVATLPFSPTHPCPVTSILLPTNTLIHVHFQARSLLRSFQPLSTSVGEPN